jgi:hypothetical protein
MEKGEEENKKAYFIGGNSRREEMTGKAKS